MREIRSRVVSDFSLGNSVLHRKLLFGRGGLNCQTSKRVRYAKRLWFGENRISLRDGLGGTSEQAIAVLSDSWRMRKIPSKHPGQPSIWSPSIAGQYVFKVIRFVVPSPGRRFGP